MAGYLESLIVRLAHGAAQLPDSFRQRQAEFLRGLQASDGGWPGREGPSDLYYTAFALRGLAVLGELDEPVANRAARFLTGRLAGRESIIDLFSLVYSIRLLQAAMGRDVLPDAAIEPAQAATVATAATADRWPQRIARLFESLRCTDGGYAKGPGGAAGSTYHTFLVLLCLQLLEQPLPDAQSIVGFLNQQRAEEGGFREIRVSKRAGTNPTAAAIGTLRILDRLAHVSTGPTIAFLAQMQTDSGGLRANTRIPIADILSTFTGLLTLTDLDAVDAVDRQELARYARSLAADGGGFLGAEWDEVYDVEYTFYGIGTMALLQLD